MSHKIIIGDNRKTLRKLRAESIQTCITSPPYWGLRDYGHSDQLGQEPTPEEYVHNMVLLFREISRVLREDGTVWLNLGDTYISNPAKGRSGSGKNAQYLGGTSATLQTRAQHKSDIPAKNLVGIPWRVAFALQADGWYLRQEIIWHKPNAMPEAVRDRCTRNHEHLFLLTRNSRYYFDYYTIQTKATTTSPGGFVTKAASKRKGTGLESTKDYIPTGRSNKRTVWTIPTARYPDSHFAVFPEELAETCIRAGSSAMGCCAHCGTPLRRILEDERIATRPAHKTKTAGKSSAVMGNRDPQRHETLVRHKGWEAGCHCASALETPRPCKVLEPFGGSGTTAEVACRLGRDVAICELNPDYIPLIRKRIAAGYSQKGLGYDQ